MAKKKAKKTDPISVFDDAPTSIAKDEDILVKDLETLEKTLLKHKLNPLEKMMAVNLLLDLPGYCGTVQEFICQKKIEIDGVCNGRKYFIVDFLIPEYQIVIETDGKIHEKPENIVRDRDRDNFLTGMGYIVFHFTWDEVMKNEEKYDVMAHVYGAMSARDDVKYTAWDEGFERGKEAIKEEIDARRRGEKK